MFIKRENLIIRSANVYDAELVRNWWNDGRIMEIVGFPNGIGVSTNDVIETILDNSRQDSQLCIIKIDDTPVGEMNYRKDGDSIAVGWKICNNEYRGHGYGTKLIILFLDYIFKKIKCNEKAENKIIWDTTIENKRAQHVYEKKILATKTRVLENSWTDQLGNSRTSIEYEIYRDDFYRLHSEYINSFLSNLEDSKSAGYNDIEIRPYNPNTDLKELWNLLYRIPNAEWTKWDGPYFENEHKVFSSPEELKGTDEEKLMLSPNRNLIIYRGKIVGLINRYWEDKKTRWLNIGIVIADANNWSKGIGKIALEKWVDKIFREEENLIHIGLTTWSGNTRMMKLAEKLGFKKEAQFRGTRFYNGFYYDSVSYGVLKDEWLKRE